MMQAFRDRAAIVLVIASSLFLLLSADTQASAQLPHFRTAADARSWSEQQEKIGNYNLAACGYHIEASMRRALGDEQAAEVEDLRADRLNTDIVLAVPVTRLNTAAPLAKLEPFQGCIVGVWDRPGQPDNAESFVRRIGRPISMSYDYLAYGAPFPLEWARQQARLGRAVQIAWEPADIAAVTDNQYLEQFGNDAAQCGTGVFLRFGGEMNGAWTAWGRDPVAYVAAFRIVHDVMARLAPDVAMVWAPNQIPLANLDKYYPGDRYVDWVGISLYTVRYYDDDMSRPAFQDSPLTMIEPFYRKYASRKPICIAECGITRRSRVENMDADDYAAARFTDLLNGLKIRYPRVKMFCFFDRDNLTGAIPGRRLNDYSLPEGSEALDSVAQALQDPYFLTRFARSESSPIAYSQVTGKLPPGYSGQILASVRTYDLHPTVTYKQRNITKTVYRPYLGSIARGGGAVTISVCDSHGKSARVVTLAAP